MNIVLPITAVSPPYKKEKESLAKEGSAKKGNMQGITPMVPNLVLKSSERVDILLCGICTNIPFEPIECKKCSKLFCTKCIESVDQSKSDKCQSCHKIWKSRIPINIYARCMIEGLNFKCKYEGCKEIISYEKFQLHVKRCTFGQQICPYGNCTFSALKKRLDKHMTKCQYRPSKCNFCGLAGFAYLEVGMHMQICPEKEWECAACHMKGNTVEMGKHACALNPSKVDLFKDEDAQRLEEEETKNSPRDTENKEPNPEGEIRNIEEDTVQNTDAQTFLLQEDKLVDYEQPTDPKTYF